MAITLVLQNELMNIHDAVRKQSTNWYSAPSPKVLALAALRTPLGDPKISTVRLSDVSGHDF
jgi:hypothetical protein